MFAVIIPFYQVTPGILNRALESVFAQIEQGWRIVIVDDGSPLRAEAEVAALPEAYRARIHIKRVENGGPGAARNVGLDMVAAMPDVHMIAFLDSDDHWESRHLERAKLALAQGDMYFCNYSWPGAVTTRFQQVQLDTRPFGVSLGDGTIRKFDGDFAELLLGSWPVCLSGLCIRKEALGRERFDARLHFSSEDQHYLLKLANRSVAIFYDCEVGLRLDHGMHFYSNRKRGELKYTRSCISNLLFHCMAQKEFMLSEKAKRINRRHIWSNLKAIIASEASSLARIGVLHFRLYPQLLRVAFYALRQRPEK